MAGLISLAKKPVMLSRDTRAVVVPDGTEVVLEQGFEVTIIQELGGDFTVTGPDHRMYRIDGEFGEHLGKKALVLEAQNRLNDAGGKLTDEIVWSQLATCYDPEIPVNIVELGLIYSMTVVSLEDSPKSRVEITMTLTAPGCGMGQVIADDVKRKVEKLSAVEETVVELVFDPPWDPSRMSEVARLTTGMM